MVERFGSSGDSGLQCRVVSALSCKGKAQGTLDNFESAIAAYCEVIERFGASNELNLKRQVVRALSCKSLIQTQIGRLDEVMRTCEELDRIFGAYSADSVETEFRWRAMSLLTEALIAQGKSQNAMHAFRLTYTAFAPHNKAMSRETLQLVPSLIAFGGPAHKLVEILSSDNVKSSILLLLVVALRQFGGESVRAPLEVCEVTVDICDVIKKSRKGRFLKDG